ncbi:hypothetical protein MKS83_20060 [Chryseobacterium sp. Y16C]|uniref:hypothetical protein n=1 Tax=Chryseobacterium sp. Y16C TaxID=2920939 RepID=UPI001F0A573B|nr:hypothetical protein [Chryseobacterium sp. Y16C]UMQ41667.1 hypothetical protein MKS83_20060 [Chryseobacterium sp. Y16C]
MAFTIFFVMFFLHGLAQQVHVKYHHVRSPIATLYEDLYVKDNDVISIQDSIINFNSGGTTSAVKQTGKPVSKNYFISKLKDNGKTKDFFFTGLDRDTKYFIHDNVAKPVWKIDETKISNTKFRQANRIYFSIFRNVLYISLILWTTEGCNVYSLMVVLSSKAILAISSFLLKLTPSCFWI